MQERRNWKKMIVAAVVALVAFGVYAHHMCKDHIHRFYNIGGYANALTEFFDTHDAPPADLQQLINHWNASDIERWRLPTDPNAPKPSFECGGEGETSWCVILEAKPKWYQSGRYVIAWKSGRVSVRPVFSWQLDDVIREVRSTAD